MSAAQPTARLEQDAELGAARGASRRRLPPWLELRAAAVWALVGCIVLYMAIDGGGYDQLVWSQVGIAVWWVVLVGAAFALLFDAGLGRMAWVAVGLFGAFVVWTALGLTWTISFERSLQTLAQVTTYFGVFALGVAVSRDRERALRHTVAALATAITVVAILALASRLRPGLFPGAQQTVTFLPGARRRLSWPVNYWNALAALLALGLPLLLALACSARTIAVRALAAAAIPVLVLCGYLTFSRGGMIAAAVGLIVFFVLGPGRLWSALTALVAAAGGVALIAAAIHRSAIEQGLGNASARHEGVSLALLTLLVCAAVGLAQVAISASSRRLGSRGLFPLTLRQGGALGLALVVVAVVIAVAGNAPGRLSHAWNDFKHRNTTALSQYSPARFGTLSGNGRYDYWKVAVNATTHGHLTNGFGPGTFQLVWLPRAPYYSYVENAHSLYLETFSDLGIPGLALLVSFFVLVLGAGVGAVIRARRRIGDRALIRASGAISAAGATAAIAAFAVSAASDWIWQVPALSASFLLLCAAVVSPSARVSKSQSDGIAESRPPSGGAPRAALARVGVRVGVAVIALGCLVTIGLPLASTTAVRRSQAAARAGQADLAVTDARSAVAVEPKSASAQIQLALSLEQLRRPSLALVDATRATSDESQNWSAWLVRSRLEAETGHATAAVADFRRARSLNPRSPVFVSSTSASARARGRARKR